MTRLANMISLTRYADLLRVPDLQALVVASLVGRMPIGIAGLAIMLLAQSSSGSFISAGIASAAYITGLAIAAPLLGRAIDRVGPRTPLILCAIAYPAGIVGLVLAILGGAHAMLVALMAITAGASFPPITVCMRAFLKQDLSGNDTLLSTAYAVESVLMELIFILGPILVAVLVALGTPAIAVLAAGLTGCSGVIMFLRAPALARWRIKQRQRGSLFGPLADRGFPPLLAVILAYSAAFGLVEIGIAGYASEFGQQAFAGVLLGLMSVGSAFGGLAYGSRSWNAPLARQFAAALSMMGIGVALLASIDHPAIFAAWSVVAGVVMAPALSIQSMLVAKNSSPQYATEAFTWSATGLLSGVGLGIAGGGILLEYFRPSAVFLTAGVVAGTASVLSLVLLKRASN